MSSHSYIYNSKNENQLGYFKTELIKPISPLYFDDKLRTSALISIFALMIPGILMLVNHNIGLIAGFIFIIMTFGIMLVGVRSAASAYRTIFIDSYGV